MAFYSAQDFEQYYVTNVTRFEQIRDEALVEVCQTRVPICDVPNEPIDSTAAKMELCRRYRPLIVKYERLLVNRTVEDDVEAMLWLTFIESIYTYNLAGTVPFTGYVKMAIHFKYLNHYKRIKQRWNYEFHIPDTADGDEQLTMDQIPDAIDVANQIVHREERVQQYHLLRRALRLLKVDQLQLMIDIYMDEVVICRMLQDSKIVHVNRCNNDINDTKGHSQRGQKNIDDAINLSISIGSTSRKQGQVVDTNTYQGGTLVSDSEVQIKARDAQQSGIGLTGETVQAKNLVLDSASDINLAAGKNTVDVKNTYKSSGWSVGAGISLTGGGLIDINASGNMARQNGDTHQESYVPTTIKAAQLAQLKAKRDTTIIGSTVSGKKVEVDTGRDLHIQSLQDVDNFKEHSKSAGFSVSSKPNFKEPTGSISTSVGRIDSKWKSVTHQAGIFAGEDGYDIHIGNGTTLEGAVIKSEAPKAKNTLTTKSLDMKDIQNEAEYTYSNNGIGYNYYGSKKKLEEMKTNDKKGY
ncbi:hemagglutinin repeat-containing protein, partial [uncultured Veillonella sp.]|uniref:hemagglutinin repeat-containing protein n=1 Tax=uncultured Veillonella sp. TaxID=159268 RepID=UPI002613F91B